jgi:hypothetical protein
MKARRLYKGSIKALLQLCSGSIKAPLRLYAGSKKIKNKNKKALLSVACVVP